MDERTKGDKGSKMYEKMSVQHVFHGFCGVVIYSYLSGGYSHRPEKPPMFPIS
jgi:hypothetical protein